MHFLFRFAKVHYLLLVEFEEDADEVFCDFVFNFNIHLCVNRHLRRPIDLDEPWLQVLINQYVEAQELIAIILQKLRVTTAVSARCILRQVQQREYDYLLNFAEYFVIIDAVTF